MMGTTIKNERHDDAEINEMARRIMEQNRAKMTQPGMPPMGYPGMPGAGPMQMARPGQPMIQNYMANNQQNGNNLPGNKASTSNGTNKPEKALDEDSRKGRFGWAEFEKTPIPFTFRYVLFCNIVVIIQWTKNGKILQYIVCGCTIISKAENQRFLKFFFTPQDPFGAVLFKNNLDFSL